MDFTTYQKKAKETAIYPAIGAGYVYPTLGLAGEAGEFGNTIKKIFRDNKGELTDETRAKLAKELGDVLWYVAQVATELGFSLDDVAQANLAKLASRKDRGVLQGSGDTR